MSEKDDFTIEVIADFKSLGTAAYHRSGKGEFNTNPTASQKK
jgi:hypothetical protein